jgi:hypothetical protein
MTDLQRAAAAGPIYCVVCGHLAAVSGHSDAYCAGGHLVTVAGIGAVKLPSTRVPPPSPPPEPNVKQDPPPPRGGWF